MRKALKFLAICICSVLCIIAIISIMRFYDRQDAWISNGQFEAIELRSEEGHFITYAIKRYVSTTATWDYVVPQWFSKYSYCQFFWCTDSNDFIIRSSDTGLHLYLFDPDTMTWHGDYYLKVYANGDSAELYYWNSSVPIAPFSPDSLPNEVAEYLKEIE